MFSLHFVPVSHVMYAFGKPEFQSVVVDIGNLS